MTGLYSTLFHIFEYILGIHFLKRETIKRRNEEISPRMLFRWYFIDPNHNKNNIHNKIVETSILVFKLEFHR